MIGYPMLLTRQDRGEPLLYDPSFNYDLTTNFLCGLLLVFSDFHGFGFSWDKS